MRRWDRMVMSLRLLMVPVEICRHVGSLTSDAGKCWQRIGIANVMIQTQSIQDQPVGVERYRSRE
jgi:hypothetical protein